MENSPLQNVLVTGATGFVGHALIPALRQRGVRVRAMSRRAMSPPVQDGVEWVTGDVLQPGSLSRVLEGQDVAYYFVHSMGKSQKHYQEVDRRGAENFAAAAAKAGVKRIIYLGGVAPKKAASKHLESRLEVGEILRRGKVPTLELRASMVVGHGSASWRIVRDLAMRLPAMVLPYWLKSRTSPIAIDDVVTALVDGLTVPLPHSAWYDIPGPAILSAEDILRKLALLRGREIPAVSIPLVTPYLSSMWLRLVTRADFSLARELVEGLKVDLLPENEKYYELTGHRPQLTFEEAALRALAAEPPETTLKGKLAKLEETLVDAFPLKASGKQTPPE